MVSIVAADVLVIKHQAINIHYTVLESDLLDQLIGLLFLLLLLCSTSGQFVFWSGDFLSWYKHVISA